MSNILQLEDLTPEQYNYFIKKIWNGVGSREFFINPHDLIFGLASILHDFEYWRGGDDSYRIAADKKFLIDCLELVRKQQTYKRPFYFVVAHIYYLFLKMLGKHAFEYSAKPATTWEELLTRFLDYQNKNKTKAKKISRYVIRKIYTNGR